MQVDQAYDLRTSVSTTFNASALDFASRLVNARDPQEIMQLQAEFIRSQIQTYGEQAKDIGAAAAKLASSAAAKTR